MSQLNENPASELNPLEDSDKEKDEKDKEKDKDNPRDESKLTPNEIRYLKDGGDYKKIVTDRENAAKAAKAELRALISPDSEGKTVIDLNEYKDFKEQIEDIESAEQMEDLVRQIQDLPKEKAKQKEKDKDEEKTLSPESKELLPFYQKWDQKVDDNKDAIGRNQVNGFKSWFRQELKSTPSIAHAKLLIKKLEGKEAFDRNGLAPRIQTLKDLNTLYKKYDIQSPLENDFIAREGHSERKEFMANAHELEDHLQKVRDTGFYSPEAIKGIMQGCLKAESPNAQNEIIKGAKKSSEQESKAFIHFRDKMVVGGVTVNKISQKSVDTILGYYKDLKSFKERQELSQHWPEAVEKEGEKITKLWDLYKDTNPEAFKKAVDEFSSLDFLEKDKALVEHEDLIKKAESKEKLEEQVTLRAASAKLDEATRKKDISTGTQKEWKEWFKSRKAYIDPDTKKDGGVEALKKNYQIMISKTPSGEDGHKNLAAFHIKRERYVTEVKKLSQVNPDLTAEELRKWQDEYDKEDWPGRKKVYKKLDKEITAQEKEQKQKKEAEKQADLSEQDKKKETMEASDTVKGCIESAQQLILDNQNEQALKTLAAYYAENLEDMTDNEKKQIEFWMGTAKRAIDEFGRGDKKEENVEKEAEKEVERLAKNDQEIKDDIDEVGLQQLNVEGVKLSENRHNKNKDAEVRAEKESLNQEASGSLEANIIEDFYEQAGDTHILDKHGRGEEIEEVKFDDQNINKEDRSHLRETTRKHQSELIKNEGFAHVTLKDKSGKTLSSQEAETHQKEDVKEVKDDLKDKAIDRLEKKAGTEKDSEAHSLHARMAAERKANTIIEEEIGKRERLREAA